MKELEGEVGDAQYAPAAKMNNKGFRKLIAAMKSDITTDDHRVTFVVITQLREAIGVMFGDNKCFQFDSRVVLADGSVEKIGNIVNKRMEVSVRTVSADGTVSSAPVVGWHDNGSGGSFIRVVCSKAGGNGRTRLTCTPDHHIRMFDGSYKEAGSLVAGDLVTAQGVGIVGECPSRKALVLSGLFGDGTLAHAHSNVSSGTHSLKVTHCTDQADYLEWKRGFFDGWVQLEPHTSHNGSAVSFSTNPFSDYVGLHRSMGFSRRVTDDFLKEVGLRELAVWFMDDGSYVRGYKGWGAGTASLACKKYSQQEREALAEHLAAMGCAPTNLDSRRIFWTGDRLRNFASVVAPYIPECMRRKLPPKMDLRKFDPSLWPVTRVAPSTILWPSEVLEVSRYCRESRCSQKKFDITVAGTHNYFVDGVAVHNCSVGGRGKKFAATTIVRLSRTKALRSEGSTAAEKMTYGLEIEASIIKNKGWGEGEKIRFNLYKENHGGFRRGDIDNVTELIPYLLLYKIVKKKGAWITLDNGDSYNGDEAMANELRGNSELLEWAMSSVREAHAHRYEDRKEVEEPAKTDKPEKAEKPVPKNLRTLSKRK
jgi:recombination protein RecA